jgi:hypothetical protein
MWIAALTLIIVSMGMVTEVAAQTGKVYGTVKNDKGEVIVGASVKLMRDGATIGGAVSDDDGKYDIYNVEPGTYALMITYDSKTIAVGDEITVSGDYVMINPVFQEYTTGEVKIVAQGGGGIVPIFTIDPIQPTGLSRAEIEDSPYRNSRDWLAAKGEVFQPDQGRELYVGGGRSSGTITFVDGVKMIGTEALPQATVEQVMLLSGGIPSEYGDVNGGVVTISTRNPGMKGYTGPARSLVNIKEKKTKAKEKGQPDSFLDQDINIDSYAFDI